MKRKRVVVDLSIKTIPTKKDKIKQPLLSQENVIPRINSSVLFIGSSGSGKTTVLANLLTRKDMLGAGVFDRIFLISPTAYSDDIQKYLKIDPDDICDNLNDAPALLRDIMDTQRTAIEQEGAHKAPLFCIVFDDCVADTDLLRAPEFIKTFIACRHYNLTTLLCSQSFKAIPRKCRLQAHNIIFFRSSGSEVECIVEDRSPPNMNKKRAQRLVEFATTEPYSFLHINMRCPYETRYRRNFDEIININQNSNEGSEEKKRTPL